MERDLVRGDLFDAEAGTFDGEPSPPEVVSAARERSGTEPEFFAAVLVRKYGTVKHRFVECVRGNRKGGESGAVRPGATFPGLVGIK